MPHNYTTQNRVDSTTCPGVTVVLLKMSERRRRDLRAKLADPNKAIRAVMREQAAIEKVPEEQRDFTRYSELIEEFDRIMAEEINPIYIQWGVKAISGLEVDGRLLDVADWQDWPSMFTAEILELVKEETDLNGAERKNFSSLTTSGEPGGGELKLSTAPSASEKDSGAEEIVPSTSLGT